MNKISFALLSLLFLACSQDQKSSKSIDNLVAEGNLEALKVRKDELSKQMILVQQQIQKLNVSLSELDTLSANTPLVTIIQVKDTVFKHFVGIQGSIKSRKNVVLSAEYSGRLLKVNYPAGTFVKKGTVLAKIDDGGLLKQLSQIKAKEELSKTIFRRRESLWNKKIGSEIEYLQAKTTYLSDKKAYEQAQEQHSKTYIKAPFSGVIDDVMIDPGNLLTLGTPVIRLVNLDEMYVEASLPESYLAGISKGAEVIISSPVLGKEINTKVRQVGSYINPGNRSFKVEIDLPKSVDNIRPNLVVKVEVNDYTNHNAILIPQNIISEDTQGLQYIYLAQDLSSNKAITQRQPISLGRISKDKVEVSGIDVGAYLIKEGARNVKDKQKVIIINDKK